MRRRLLFAVGGGQRRRFTVCQQGEIEQAMGVVVGWAKQLAAGNVFINRGNTPFETHPGGVERLAYRQLRQRGAVGAQQENRFNVIAAGLFQRQRRQFAVGNAAFGHHAIYREVKLLFNLGDAQFGQIGIASASALLQGVGGVDRLLAPFHGNVHQHTST